MGPDRNLIKCKFCEWTTNKFGGGSTPPKAFARLREHIRESHWDDDRQKLVDLGAENEDSEIDDYLRSEGNPVKTEK